MYKSCLVLVCQEEPVKLEEDSLDQPARNDQTSQLLALGEIIIMPKYCVCQSGVVVYNVFRLAVVVGAAELGSCLGQI